MSQHIYAYTYIHIHVHTRVDTYIHTHIHLCTYANDYDNKNIKSKTGVQTRRARQTERKRADARR